MPLWRNNSLKINGKSILIKELYSRGIKVLRDIVNPAGEIMCYEELVEIYGIEKLCRLQYHGFYSCVKKYVKDVDIQLFSHDIYIYTDPI